MRIFFICLTCFGLLFQHSAYSFADKKETIEVGVVEFMPYFYKKYGRFQGTVIEKFNRIAKEAGYKVNYQLCPMKRIVEQNNQGELDVILLLTSVFGEGEVLVSDQKLCDIELMTYSVGDKSAVSSLDGLKGERVGMFRGFCLGGLVDYLKSPENNIDYYEVSTHKQLFNMLKLGRLDYIVNYRRPSEYVLNDLDINNLNSASINKFDGHMLVSTKAKNIEPEKLMLALNQAYDKLLTNNELSLD